MLFFEFDFILAFLIFYSVYLLTHNVARNFLLLTASFGFYCMWDWRFAPFLLVSIVVDFCAAKLIDAPDASRCKRKLALLLSLAINLSLLGFFKYFNFFIENLAVLLSSFGLHPNVPFLRLVLPIGISFYTFQTICYTVDVYKKRIRHEPNFLNYATYVAFFPQLIAGPIERASSLLPQIKAAKCITIEKTFIGVRLFLWGIFKKLYVADNLALVVDPIFSDPQGQTTLALILGAYCFAFQIYCDFSGYTDMARGLGKMLGIDLSVNFNLPYFSKSLREFWRSWHITLSNWFRDYIFIPLGGTRNISPFKVIRNIFLTFTLSGLWHGAGWPFLIWGMGHGILAISEYFLRKSFLASLWHAFPSPLRIIIIFHIICSLWIIFRAPDLDLIWMYLDAFGRHPSLNWPEIGSTGTILDTCEKLFYSISQNDRHNLFQAILFICPLLIIQMAQHRAGNHFVDFTWSIPFRVSVYTLLLILLIIFGVRDGKQFIYFQF